MNQASSRSAAVTVAVQVLRSKSEVSPNMSPALSRATVRISPPGSESTASALPFAST
jgi:hypothetical protein